MARCWGWLGVAVVLPWAGAAMAQSAGQAGMLPLVASSAHFDTNLYPTLGQSSGPFDVNAGGTQAGAPGVVAMSGPAPAPAYSFKDMLDNTHGYISTGVATRGGYNVDAGAIMPIVPGKVDLDVGGGVGQIGLGKLPNGKTASLPYDDYHAGVHLHPSDDFDAYIGVTGLRLHGPAYSPYGYP